MDIDGKLYITDELIIKYGSYGTRFKHLTFPGIAYITYILPTALPSSGYKFLQCTSGGIWSWENITLAGDITGTNAATTIAPGVVVDNDISASAAISGSKISGWNATNWNAAYTHSTTTHSIALGGTGQTTANATFNALAPSQTGHSGKFLTTNGAGTTSWAVVSGGGTGYKSFTWTIPGIQVAGDKRACSIIIPFDFSLTDGRCYVYVQTAPTGSSLVVDIHNSAGTSIFITKPTITNGNYSANSSSFSITSFLAGVTLDVSVDSTGSITPGSDLTVVLRGTG